MKRINLLSNKGNIIEGPLLFIPKLISDDRGFFYESWNKNAFDEFLGSKITFLQDNHSKSYKSVLRGLHYQLPEMAQGKLIKCSYGKVFDVAVDLRKSSSTFTEWVSVELNDKDKNIFWIPEGFAHGFFTLSDFAEVQYKTTQYWCRDSERTIFYGDKHLNINWPLNILGLSNPIVNKRDLDAPTLNKLELKNELFE